MPMPSGPSSGPDVAPPAGPAPSVGPVVAVIAVGVAVAGGAVGGMVGDLRLPLVALAVGGAAAAAVIRRPAGLFLLGLLVWTRASHVAEVDHGYPGILVPFTVVLVVTGLVRLWRERPRGTGPAGVLAAMGAPTVVLGLAFAAYGAQRLVGLVHAAEPERVMVGLVELARDGLIVSAVALGVRTRADLRALVWGVVVGGAALGAVGVAQWATGTWSDDWWGFAKAGFKSIAGGQDDFRQGGSIGDPNFHAQIMVVAGLLAFERAVGEGRRALRLAAGVCGAVTAAGVALTYSRGGLLAAAAGVVTLAVVFRPRPRHVVAAVAVVGLVLAAAPDVYRERLASITEAAEAVTGGGGATDNSIEGRTSELLVGLRMFADHPWLGVGYDHYRYHHLDYSRRIGLDDRRTERAAHNLYLEHAAEGGVVGLAALAAVLAVAVAGVLRARRWAAAAVDGPVASLAGGLLAALVAYLTASLFLHLAYPRPFWLLIAACAVAPQAVRAPRVPTGDRPGPAVPVGVGPGRAHRPPPPGTVATGPTAGARRR